MQKTYRVLRISEVMNLLGVRRTKLYELDRQGELRKINLSPRCTGWLEDEVIDYIEKKKKERDSIKAK